MTQSNRQNLRPTLTVLTVAALCLFILLTAFFPVSTANAGEAESPLNRVLAVPDQPTLAAAITFTVNTLTDLPDAAIGNGICDSNLATAGNQCTLRAAIQESNAVFGDETIDFSVTGTINLTSVLPNIASNLSLSGPGSGLLTIRRDTGGDYRIFTINNGLNINLLGLTLTNGRTPDSIGSATAESGGGILQASGTLLLTDVVITGNRTGNGGENNTGSNSFGGWGGFGGGLYGSGTITLVNCVVSGNRTGNGGGGGYGGSGGRGAGIYFASGTATLRNVTITGNNTGDGGTGINGGLSGGNSGYGAGIWSGGDFFPAQPTSLNMTNVTITNNRTGNVVRGNAGGGAGIYIYKGTANLANSTISNNHTGNGSGPLSSSGNGGGISSDGTLTVVGSAITGNTTGDADSSGVGGGISNGFILTLINSTISGNTMGEGSSRGGGIYNGATLTMINTTVTGNLAGLGNGLVGNSTTNVRNSIIAGNGPGGNGPDLFSGFSPVSLNSQGHNLIGNSENSSGFTNGTNGDQVGSNGAVLNPMLGPLANNGGPTLTHALLSSSSALDAGDNCVTQPTHCGDPNIPQLTTDQRGPGFSRMIDGPDADAVATVDIGAYEYPVVFPNLTDVSTNEDTPFIVGFGLDDPGSVISVAATSSNATLVPNNPTNISVATAGSTTVLTINPVPNLSGTADITVTVNRTSGSAARTFRLTVNPVNDAPSFTKGPDQSVNENDPAQAVNTGPPVFRPGQLMNRGKQWRFK